MGDSESSRELGLLCSFRPGARYKPLTHRIRDILAAAAAERFPKQRIGLTLPPPGAPSCLTRHRFIPGIALVPISLLHG